MDTSSKVLDREGLIQRLIKIKDDNPALQEWIYPKMTGLFEALQLHNKTEPEDIASMFLSILEELEESRRMREVEEDKTADYVRLARGIAEKTLGFSFVFTGDEGKDEEVVLILLEKVQERTFLSAD